MCLGIPGRIVAIVDERRKLALVDVGGVRREINIACIVGERAVADCVGDWVLVHVGFAMSRHRRGRGGRDAAHPGGTWRSPAGDRRDGRLADAPKDKEETSDEICRRIPRSRTKPVRCCARSRR